MINNSIHNTTNLKMCYAKNVVIHNLYNQHHTVDRFITEEKDTKINHQKIEYGIVCQIYDIRTLKIKYNGSIMNYRKEKLAEIIMQPYIPDYKYLHIIHILEDYFTDKSFRILHTSNNTVYLYDDQECLNTLINNIIVLETNRSP